MRRKEGKLSVEGRYLSFYHVIKDLEGRKEVRREGNVGKYEHLNCDNKNSHK